MDPEDNRDLAKVPLVWMLEKARGAGLVLKQGAWETLQARADPLAPQHDAPPRVEPWLSMGLRALKLAEPR